jgi:adenine/guanine phosphoribosyltransferase-like PRPP-binding protein
MLQPLAFKHSIDLLVERYADKKIDVVAGARRVQDARTLT